MSRIFEHIVASPMTDGPRQQLEAEAQRAGLGKNLPTKLSCSIFKDHYSGKQMRAIGGIFYAPSYIPKGEGAWHIKIFAGATSSDILTLLETVITVMGRGLSAVSRILGNPTGHAVFAAHWMTTPVTNCSRWLPCPWISKRP
jgi:hypothetical protein